MTLAVKVALNPNTTNQPIKIVKDKENRWLVSWMS